MPSLGHHSPHGSGPCPDFPALLMLQLTCQLMHHHAGNSARGSVVSIIVSLHSKLCSLTSQDWDCAGVWASASPSESSFSVMTFLCTGSAVTSSHVKPSFPMGGVGWDSMTCCCAWLHPTPLSLKAHSSCLYPFPHPQAYPAQAEGNVVPSVLFYSGDKGRCYLNHLQIRVQLKSVMLTHLSWAPILICFYAGCKSAYALHYQGACGVTVSSLRVLHKKFYSRHMCPSVHYLPWIV